MYAPGIAAPVMIEPEDRNKFCKRCEQFGHCNANSRKCKYFVPRKLRKEADKPQSSCPGKSIIVMKHLEEDGNEQELLDSISFDVVGDLTAGLLNNALDDEVANNEDDDINEEDLSDS